MRPSVGPHVTGGSPEEELLTQRATTAADHWTERNGRTARAQAAGQSSWGGKRAGPHKVEQERDGKSETETRTRGAFQ